MDYLNDNYQICGLHTNVLFLAAALTQNKILSFNKFKRYSIHLNIVLCGKIVLLARPQACATRFSSVPVVKCSFTKPLDMTHREILLLIERWPLVCKRVDPLYNLVPQICVMFKLIESQQ